MTDSLVEWLTAILDEDERIALAAKAGGTGEWPFGCHHYDWDGNPEEPGHGECCVLANDEIHLYDEGGHSQEDVRHIAQHDPRSVLADIAAKRAMIELHDGSHECSTYDHNGDIDNCTWVPDGGCTTVQLLASAYRHRPGYDPQWAPT